MHYREGSCCVKLWAHGHSNAFPKLQDAFPSRAEWFRALNYKHRGNFPIQELRKRRVIEFDPRGPDSLAPWPPMYSIMLEAGRRELARLKSNEIEGVKCLGVKSCLL